MHLHVHKLWLITWPPAICVWNMLIILIMIFEDRDVISCVICISNEVEYLEKERSCKNSTKEFTLSFYVIFTMQSKERLTKFRCIGRASVIDVYLGW